MRKQKIDRDWMSQEPKTRLQVMSAHPLEALKTEVKSVEDLPNLLSSKDAAEILRIHYKTAEELMRSQRITSMKIGKNRFTTPHFINVYLANEIKKNG